MATAILKISIGHNHQTFKLKPSNFYSRISTQDLSETSLYAYTEYVT